MNLLRQLALSRDPNITVANLVDELLRRGGDCETSVGEDGRFRLSHLQRDIANIDAFLRQSVAIKPGELVAIYRSNDRECFHWFLAVIRAGGVAVPLNPLLSLPEVRRILAESGTSILVTDKAVFERTILDRAALPVRLWIEADDEPQTMEGFLRAGTANETYPPVTIDPRATIAIFHTSGTSGFPKGAALSSRALLGARASTIFSKLILGPGDLALVALPWSHIMAVSIALYGLMAGIPGCFMRRFDVESALTLSARFGITAFVGVPAMFTRLVNSDPDPVRLATVRLWLSASDHLPAEVRARLRRYGALLRMPGGRRLPPVLINGYGMVELGGLAMMGVELSFLPGSGDVCFPVPPFQIRVVGDDGRPMPHGKPGECQIRRHGTAPHYWAGNPQPRDDSPQVKGPQQESAEELLTADGWLRTGDLATRNRLGMIRLVGRIKEVIKSGGYSVYVRELEEAVLAHPAVARVAAFGLPHKDKGEFPAAAVELHSSARATEQELVDFCRQNLAVYKAPRRIWILPEGGLPQNHNGKTLRRVLRERFTAELK